MKNQRRLNRAIAFWLLAIFVPFRCYSQTHIDDSNLDTQGKALLKSIAAQIKASPEASPYFKKSTLNIVGTTFSHLAKDISNGLVGQHAYIEDTSSAHNLDGNGNETGSNVTWQFKQGVTIIPASEDGRVPAKQLLTTDRAIILSIVVASGHGDFMPFDRKFAVSGNPRIVVCYRLETKKEDKMLRRRIEQIIRHEVSLLT